TSGNNTSMAKSYALALAAAKHISGKLSLPVNESAVSLFDAQLEKGFSEKITKGKLQFYGLAGFEPTPLPAGLGDHFDQQLELPGEKFSVRYFVISNPEGEKLNLADSVVYKKYCGGKKMASLSVSLNVMMGRPGDMPKSREIKDRDECRKINNSDYIIEYMFEVSSRSELAKGYKYCYMYAAYKQGSPDCYVVFLSDDPANFSLFRQVYKTGIKYPG
ncbi:MAG TPA: hypothetical protein VGO58_14935, partial [Chitinophagaceae bacterium]|nr:hypothetical protein [Chitinophagaceae bacterium]